MAAEAGRNLLIDIDDFAAGTEVEIAGQLTGTITINREPIDVTTKSDSGVRALLAELGVFGVDIGFEAVLENAVYLALAMNAGPTALGAGTVTIGSIGTITGSFFLGQTTVTGADGPNSIGIESNLMSSGTVTFT